MTNNDEFTSMDRNFTELEVKETHYTKKAKWLKGRIINTKAGLYR
jgi:hypothetical protein